MIKHIINGLENRKIFHKDITAEDPTVNALDPFAAGFRRYRATTTVEGISNDKCIGFVKCRVEPPKDLYIHVLPCNNESKLFLHG